MTLLERLVNRVQLMIGKALLEAVRDTDEIQLVKVSGLEDEIQEGIEHVQPYGLTGNAPAGSECVIVFVGGNREHGVAVVIGNGEYRPKNLQAGEVALWSKFGKNIHLNKGGEIAIGWDGLTALTDYAVAFNDLKTAFNELKSAYNSHTHVITVSGAVPAAPPTPVTGSSAAPTPQSAANIDAAKVEKVRLP